MKKILLGIFIFLNIVLLQAQTPYYRIYDGRFGLPSSEVYNVTQDERGYLWFTTDHGLARFDGYEFVTFDMQDGLPENAVFHLRKDQHQRIWFNTYDGKLGYLQNGQIFPYQYNQVLADFFEQMKITYTVFQSFYVDNKNKVHFYLNGPGAFSIDADGKLEIENLDQPYLLKIQLNDDGDISFQGAGYGIIEQIIYQKGDTSYQIAIKEKANFYVSMKNLKALWYQNAFYLGYNKSIYRYIDGILTDSISCGNNLAGMKFDANGNMWAYFVTGGVYVLDKHLKLKHQYYKNEFITDFYQDHEGGIWLTTLNKGIFYIPDLRHKLYTVNDGVPNVPIVDFAVDWQSRLWIALGSGKLGYLSKTGMRYYDLKLQHSNSILQLLIDNKNKRVWVATNNYLFYIEKEQLHQLSYMLDEQKKVFYPGIKTITFDSVMQKLWIGNFNGVSYNEFNQKLMSPKKIKDDFVERIESIEIAGNNAIWIGSTRGLYHFDGDTLVNYGKHFPSLLGGRIITMKALGDSLWIGTRGNGLLLLTPDTLRQFTDRDGFPFNSVSKIEVSGNFLIVGSNSGLVVIKRKLEQEKIVLHRQLATTEMVSKEIVEIIQNERDTYVLSRRGVSVFRDITEPSAFFQIPVLLRQILVKNKPIAMVQGSNIAYADNSLSFDYFGISFRKQGKHTYRHRLLGLENEWVNNQQTFAQYPYLPPGVYRFEVEVMNIDGSWSKSNAAFDFTILPPFWRQWWFIAVMVFIGLLFALAVIRIYGMRISRQKQLVADINRYHQDALANQMNPHFLFNSLNTLQRYILENDKLASSRYLSKFSNLMRTMLSNAQHQRISLENEIEALTLYIEVEVARFKDRFTFELQCDPEIDLVKTTIPVFFIQPLVENAIKHGLMNKPDHGKLTIRIYKRNKTLYCEVLDNGVGRIEAQKIANKLDKQSLGVSIIQKRISLINKSTNEAMRLEYEDLLTPQNQGAGTRATLIFPNILNNTL